MWTTMMGNKEMGMVMKRIPRASKALLMFSAIALFMGVFAGKDILPASYDNVPSVILPFVILFITAWFLVIGFFFLFGLTALQTVEMDRDEIRVYLGPWIIRRIPSDDIKTVGLCVTYNKGRAGNHMLVLSSKTVEELNEKGTKKLQNDHLRKRIAEQGVLPEGKYAGAKTNLFGHYLWSPLWLEDSEEARGMLKKNLTKAVFLI